MAKAQLEINIKELIAIIKSKWLNSYETKLEKISISLDKENELIIMKDLDNNYLVYFSKKELK